MSKYVQLNFSVSDRLAFPTEFKYSKMDYNDTNRSKQLVLDMDSAELILKSELIDEMFDKSKRGFPFIEEDDKNNYKIRYGDNKWLRLNYENGVTRIQHIRPEGNFFITINSATNNYLISREMFLYLIAMMKNTLEPAHVPFLGKILGFNV